MATFGFFIFIFVEKVVVVILYKSSKIQMNLRTTDFFVIFPFKNTRNVILQKLTNMIEPKILTEQFAFQSDHSIILNGSQF